MAPSLCHSTWHKDPAMEAMLAEETPSVLPLMLRTSAAQVHRGVTIVPILSGALPRERYITLAEALPFGYRVSEVDASGHVPELLIQNPLNRQVLLHDGEEVVGAKRNRMLEATILVVAGLTQKFPVACAEAGRWHRTSADYRN